MDTQKDFQSYYNREKSYFNALIPDGQNKILELGCAAGHLGKNLRKANKAGQLVGVELNEAAAEAAKSSYDKIHVGDIENLNLEYNEDFDIVICGDVIEHLRDPWKILSRIHEWLKKDGCLICSIPNIRYWRILRDLIFLGKWQYVDAGILDNTHLRFFTRKCFLEMLRNEHFIVDFAEMKIWGIKHNTFNKITFGFFEEFLGSQIIIKAIKS